MSTLFAIFSLLALCSPAVAAPTERRQVPARVPAHLNSYTCSFSISLQGYPGRTFTHTKRNEADAAAAVYVDCLATVEDLLASSLPNSSLADREEKAEQVCVAAYPKGSGANDGCRLNRAI